MKNWSSFTLMGNWVEDRSKAPPLRGGVMPDYGFNEKTTQAAVDFRDPTASVIKQVPLRFGMVCAATLSEASYAYGEGIPASDKLDASTMRATSTREPLAPPAHAAADPYTTTARDMFKGATGIGSAAATAAAEHRKHLTHSAFAPAAGGKAFLGLDRGRKTVGITGEVIRTDSEPKNNTAAQRAWLGGGRVDPGVAFHLAPPPAPAPVTYMSLPLQESEAAAPQVDPSTVAHGRYAAYAAPPRVVTAITATQADLVRKPGRRIFSDEPF